MNCDIRPPPSTATSRWTRALRDGVASVGLDVELRRAVRTDLRLGAVGPSRPCRAAAAMSGSTTDWAPTSST
jgi:hypothetical protein